MSITDNSCVTHHGSEVIFDRIHFREINLMYGYILEIIFSLCNHQCFNKTCTTYTNKVNFNNCVFVNNEGYGIISGIWHDKLHEIEQNIIIIKECVFVNNVNEKCSIILFL